MELEAHPAGGLYLTGAFRLSDLGELLMRHDEVIGAAGLWFEHAEIVQPEAVRVAASGVLRLMLADKPVFVMDPLSAEWAGHYQLPHAEVGGHPDWLATGRMYPAGEKARTVRECFYHAVRGLPFKIVPLADGFTPQDTVNPVVRWAAQYGCQELLAQPGKVSRDIVERERARARETLDQLVTVATPAAPARHAVTVMPQMEGADEATVNALATALGGGGPRVMEIGSIFDPATHYDKHYYGGAEGGIRYLGSDGKWKTYQGPGHEWSGNVWVARQVANLLALAGEGTTHLDIGCGAGHFVLCMREQGWESYGVDLSEDAAFGNPHVMCEDFAEMAQGPAQGEYDLVTALDFWEHIWEHDVDRLLRAAVELLVPGGLHFAIVCTRGGEEKDFVASPGVTVNAANAWALVSGHVNIRDWKYWARKFRDAGLRLRYDLMYLFQVLRDESPTMSQVRSWAPKNLLIGERVGSK